MSDLPLLYLCADGEVLREHTRNGLDVVFTNGAARYVNAINDDPCIFSARVCGTCEGSGDDLRHILVTKREAGRDFYAVCPTCIGSKLDESVPLEMVGVLSVLVRESDDTRWVVLGTSPRWTTLLSLDEEIDRGSRITIETSDIGPDKAWTVVRAVPPMRGTDDE